MIALESIQLKLGIAEPWVESRGTHWLSPGSLGLRDVAKVMIESHARFITITCYQLPGVDGFRLEYHWDLDGCLVGIPFGIAGSSIDSIFDLSEAADWIEREIHEEYSIDFTGRAYEPLLLREGDKLGVNLRETATPGASAAGAAAQKEVAK